MAAKSGFRQINFQVPDRAFEKLENECNGLGMTKGEFCTRLITSYFLSKEMDLPMYTFGRIATIEHINHERTKPKEYSLFLDPGV